MIMSPKQAFCGNEDCDCFCWNMTQTRAENQANVNVIDLGKLKDAP